MALLALIALLVGCGVAHEPTESTADQPAATPRAGPCRSPDRTLDDLASQLKTGTADLPAPHEPVARAPEPEGILLGVQAALRSRGSHELGDILTRMADAHLRYSREDFTWSTIEPHPRSFCWARTDFWMYGAARAGIEIIAVPDAPPRWAEPSPTTAPTDRKGLQAYAAFVRELLGRYGSYGSFWNQHPELRPDPISLVDVWNEPYSSQFWSRSFPDPGGYAAMFEAVVHAARPVDPRAQFLLEADTTALTPKGQKPFLRSVLNARPHIAEDAYAVSLHPYASNGWGPGVCDKKGSVETRRLQVCRIRDVRRILDAHGASKVRLMLTELGWGTDSTDGVRPRTVGRYIHQTFSLLRTRWKGLIAGLIWYEYQSPDGGGPYSAPSFELVRPDGVPRPGWHALAEEARVGVP